MNRWDGIKSAALGVAQHVTQDRTKHGAVADDLITLIGLMIDAVGKGVAVKGETDMNGVDGVENAKAHGMYLIGEAMQTQADHVAREAKDADLSRYAMPVRCPSVPRCPECLRAEGDGHAHGCRRVSTVTVHLSHDLDLCDVTSDAPACDWDMSCPVHDDTFGR